MRWDCATFSASELLPNGLPDRLDSTAAAERHWRERLQMMQTARVDEATGERVFNGAADDSVESFWIRAVRDYTACSLTNCLDRMAAIWGIAKLVRDQTRLNVEGEEYGVGLWRWNLTEQLAWKSVDYRKAKRHDGLKDFPSWSWASLMGEIEPAARYVYLDTAGKEIYYRVEDHGGEVLSFYVTTSQGENYQPVMQRNTIAIRGSLIKSKLTISTTGHHCDWEIVAEMPGDGSQQTDFSSVSRHFEVFPDTAEDACENSCCFMLVLVASQSARHPEQGMERDPSDHGADVINGIGLVLERLPREEEYKPCCRRTGSFHFRGIGERVYERLSGGVKQGFWLC